MEQSIASNLKAIHVFFGQYSATHQGRAPTSESEFKTFISSLDASKLESMAISTPDSLFVSPRDGKPLSIRYNLPASMPGVGTTQLLASEDSGKDGKRFVLLTTGEIEEVDQARFDELSAKK